jgi:hypothetical protein
VESKNGPARWHFWTDDTTAAATQGWDPDTQPDQFASGIGHNLLELYMRLRARGLPVTIGSRIPRETALVVVYHQAWDRRRELGLAFATARYRTAVIRSDAPLWWRSLITPDLVVTPNSTTVPLWRDRLRTDVRHIPALPQRGLIPRDPNRYGEVRRAVFKGNPVSVPGYLRTRSFADALSELGVELVLDVPASTDGADQSWHDFHDADVVLCVRGAARDDSLLNKPATRLINSWCAGSIPIVDPEPAYLELVRNDVDGFVAQSPDEIIAAVDRLTQDPQLAERMTQHARERSAAYDRDVILDQWVAALHAAAGARRGYGDTSRRHALAIARHSYRMVRATLGVVRRALEKKVKRSRS